MPRFEPRPERLALSEAEGSRREPNGAIFSTSCETSLIRCKPVFPFLTAFASMRGVPMTARSTEKECLMKLVKLAFAALIALTASQAMVTTVHARETAPATQAATAKLNINTADAKEIAKLMKGIGPKKAEAIVAYRTEHGPFRKVEDLLKVKGVGAATLTRNADRLVF
jgi:competence protein ComEA